MLRNSRILRRIALGGAVAAILVSCAACTLAVVQSLTAGAADITTALAVGFLALGAFAVAFFFIYILDTRRDSRTLRSIANYSKLAAIRTRSIATQSSQVIAGVRTLQDRPLPPSMEYLDRRFMQITESFTEQSIDLHSEIATSTNHLLERTQELLSAIAAVNAWASPGDQSLSLELEKAIDRIYALGEGLLATYTLRPSAPLAPMRGWAISPDLSALLVYLIAAERPTTIIEMGSGVSTAIMGLALSQAGTGRLISLEHDPEYAAKTEAMLRVHGIDHLVNVVHAPLVEHEVNGQTVLWYDMSAVDLDGPIDLIVIDGPPKTSGPRARYPALHILKEHIQPGTVIVVDDANRKEEVEMISSWNEEVRPLSVEFLPHEKGTAVIRIPE